MEHTDRVADMDSVPRPAAKRSWRLDIKCIHCGKAIVITLREPDTQVQPLHWECIEEWNNSVKKFK